MIFKMLHNILHCKFNISNTKCCISIFAYIVYLSKFSDSVLYVVNVKFNVLTVQNQVLGAE